MKITYKLSKNFLDQLIEDRLRSAVFKRVQRRKMIQFVLIMMIFSGVFLLGKTEMFFLITLWVTSLVMLMFFPGLLRKVSKVAWTRAYQGHLLPRGERNLTFDKKGLRYQGKGFDLKYDWTQVHSLKEEGRFYSIVLHGLSQIHLPKKALKGNKAKAEFEKFFETI